MAVVKVTLLVSFLHVSSANVAASGYCSRQVAGSPGCPIDTDPLSLLQTPKHDQQQPEEGAPTGGLHHEAVGPGQLAVSNESTKSVRAVSTGEVVAEVQEGQRPGVQPWGGNFRLWTMIDSKKCFLYQHDSFGGLPGVLSKEFLATFICEYPNEYRVRGPYLPNVLFGKIEHESWREPMKLALHAANDCALQWSAKPMGENEHAAKFDCGGPTVYERAEPDTLYFTSEYHLYGKINGANCGLVPSPETEWPAWPETAYAGSTPQIPAKFVCHPHTPVEFGIDFSY